MNAFMIRMRALLSVSGLVSAGVISLVIIVGAGLSLRMVEPELGLTHGDAAWWAVTTATTVGYGDIVPETSAGRSVAAFVMLIGVGFVSILTGAMAKVFFLPEAQLIEAEEDRILAELQSMTARLEAIERRIGER